MAESAKAAFHDTGIDTDIDILARMPVSVSCNAALMQRTGVCPSVSLSRLFSNINAVTTPLLQQRHCSFVHRLKRLLHGICCVLSTASTNARRVLYKACPVSRLLDQRTLRSFCMRADLLFFTITRYIATHVSINQLIYYVTHKLS